MRIGVCPICKNLENQLRKVIWNEYILFIVISDNETVFMLKWNIFNCKCKVEARLRCSLTCLSFEFQNRSPSNLHVFSMIGHRTTNKLCSKTYEIHSNIIRVASSWCELYVRQLLTRNSVCCFFFFFFVFLFFFYDFFSFFLLSCEKNYFFKHHWCDQNR